MPTGALIDCAVVVHRARPMLEKTPLEAQRRRGIRAQIDEDFTGA
jgi:hypothetical protein